jgi:hypothetical protein
MASTAPIDNPLIVLQYPQEKKEAPAPAPCDAEMSGELVSEIHTAVGGRAR